MDAFDEADGEIVTAPAEEIEDFIHQRRVGGKNRVGRGDNEALSTCEFTKLTKQR
jgi:hypothetical protein